MPQATSADRSFVSDIKVQWRTDGSYSTSRAADISAKGAFINTPNPLPVGTVLGLRLEAAGREITAQAVVRRVIEGDGMGIEFQAMSPDDRIRLDLMVRRAEQQEVAQAADSGKRSQVRPRSRLQKTNERRSRVRYKFSATAEIVEAGAEQSVSGQISDLGASGCYVKIDSPFPAGTALEVRIAHNGQSFHACAAVKSSHPDKGMSLSFSHLDAPDKQILDEWLTASMERAWLATNRRRSQRVMVSIPVHVETTDRFGAEHREVTKTVSVSANGALLVLEMEVSKGQTVTLRDPVTNDALECSVNYLGTAQQGRREVGVSFVKPNQSLWRIAFPPSDWSMQDPYAKGS
jgi:hypothetical protein